MPDIVISEFMDKNIAFEVLDNLDVQYDPMLVDDRAALLETVAEARAIIVRNRTQVDSELLEHAPNLKVVGRLGVGLDNIDLEACRSRNVVVCPATGANDVAVAEYTITAALILMRGAWTATDRMIDGEWPRTDLMGREISGKRLGLIGFGSIARQVAARAMALGFDAVVADYYWLQAVQLVGGTGHVDVESGRKIGKLIDVVTTLDPWVSHPYRFAGLWMTESEALVRDANRLLRRGIERHPDEWRHYFYLGFNPHSDVLECFDGLFNRSGLATRAA